MAGGPPQIRASLQVGDVILTVNGVPTGACNHEQVTKMLVDNSGAARQLTVLPGAGTKTLTVPPGKLGLQIEQGNAFQGHAICKDSECGISKGDVILSVNGEVTTMMGQHELAKKLLDTMDTDRVLIIKPAPK